MCFIVIFISSSITCIYPKCNHLFLKFYNSFIICIFKPTISENSEIIVVQYVRIFYLFNLYTKQIQTASNQSYCSLLLTVFCYIHDCSHCYRVNKLAVKLARQPGECWCLQHLHISFRLLGERVYVFRPSASCFAC